MKILVLDNYDSFTYNLVQMVREIEGDRVDVFRNDKIALEEVDRYDKILLSPGPGIPRDAGILLSVIKKYAAIKDIFGVCLGMQAIAEVFGGTIYNSKKLYHGVASPIIQQGEDAILSGLPQTFEAGRYHSWLVEKGNFPQDLMITATDPEGAVMALKHRKYDVGGVQFHPESVLTPLGEVIIKNWLYR